MFTKAMIGLAAAVAFAASMAPAIGAGSKVRVARQAQSYLPPPAYGPRADRRDHSINPAYDVYTNGKYAGSDPDPFIRSQLADDPPWNYMK